MNSKFGETGHPARRRGAPLRPGPAGATLAGMRLWYYLLAAGVVFYAVCEFAELGEKAALGGRQGRRSAAASAASAPSTTPEVPPDQWRSAPASGERRAVKRGQGVLIEQATGKRFQTR